MGEITSLPRDMRPVRQEQSPRRPKLQFPDGNIEYGDSREFKLFTLRVRALVGMLDQFGDNGQTELHCGSHVTRLLSKLPQDMRAEFKRFLCPIRIAIPSLLHFSDWLDYELKIQETVSESLCRDDKSRAGTRVECHCEDAMKDMNVKPAAENTSCLIRTANEFCTWGGGLDASRFCSK